MKKIIFFFILLFSSFCFATTVNKENLKVAFYTLDGFFEYDEENRERGYGVELLKKLSEYSKYNFEYIKTDSWEETKTKLLSGEADIRMPGTLPKSPSTTLVYSKESIMDSYIAVMTLENRKDLFYKDYERFTTMKFAMTKNMYKNTDVTNYISSVNIPQKNIVIGSDYDQCKEVKNF